MEINIKNIIKYLISSKPLHFNANFSFPPIRRKEWQSRQIKICDVQKLRIFAAPKQVGIWDPRKLSKSSKIYDFWELRNFAFRMLSNPSKIL
jgi:hypothetical protein